MKKIVLCILTLILAVGGAAGCTPQNKPEESLPNTAEPTASENQVQ